MPTPFFSDIYKLFYYATKQGPIESIEDSNSIEGVGVTSPDAQWDLKNASWNGGGSPLQIQIAETQDTIDLTSVTNRKSRYKEYDRLENVPEIHTALNTFADEACIGGNTNIATPFGYITIKELAETKNPEERFLVYCWDFEKNDYSLGWAYHPRLVKTAPVVKVLFDNGMTHYTTPDHRFLTMEGEWVEAKDLQYGTQLKPFYRLSSNRSHNDLKTQQFARIFTFNNNWIHERQFIDEWKTNKKFKKYEKVNEVARYIGLGLNFAQICEAMNAWIKTVNSALRNNGFTYKELRYLNDRYATCRTVSAVIEQPEMEVYDLSVEQHANFATDATIVHNCQTDDDGKVFKIKCKNVEIQEEANFLVHELLELDDQAWSIHRNLCKYGDNFFEIVIDPHKPRKGILKAQVLPADSMYIIESIKNKIIEYQQSNEGPDYQSLQKVDITKASQAQLMQATALRFHPGQIVHARIGDNRKQFYPYGVSTLQSAIGPAQQLKLMEDAMLVNRLCLTGDSRVRTINGWKYIKDISLGDIVYSYAQDETICESMVLHQVCNGQQEVFRVRSKHVEIKGTSTHPILVNRGGVVQYVDIKDLKIKKDKLILLTHNANEHKKINRIIGEPWAKLSPSQRKEFKTKCYNNISYLLNECPNALRAKPFLYSTGKSLPLDTAIKICEIFGLDHKKLIILNKNERNYERINLPQYVDEEFAQFLGFMYGDGHISKNRINFSTGVDDKINKKYYNIMKKYFGVVAFHEDKRSKKGYGKYIVNSTIASNILKDLGYDGTHDKCRVPNWLFNAPKNIRRAFVEGLSDADGCERYTTKGTWFSTIELSNKGLIEDIKELWSSIGLSSGKITGRNRQTYHKINENRWIKGGQSYSVTITKILLPLYENVIGVEQIENELVYDITVDNIEHNFIVNGTCVHNTRAPERRVFYVDVGQIAPNRAEAMMDRLKDQFRKKKVFSGKSGGRAGASSVDEKWNPMPPDEDIFIPVRPGSTTRIDTLPGAQNLSEIDDSLYFRNRLFTALQFPKNYLTNEDAGASRLTLSQQDVRFARFIERLQKPLVKSVKEIVVRHLQLRGFPLEMYKDLEVKMTPPSDWRLINRNEVTEVLFGRAATMKGAQLFSDYDIHTRILGLDEDEAEKIVARTKAQKYEDLKMQVIGQNAEALGLVPMQANDGMQIGASPGGPNPMLSPNEQPALGGPQQGTPGLPPTGGEEGGDGGELGGEEEGQDSLNKPQKDPGDPKSQIGPDNANDAVDKLPDPDDDDIKKYDMTIGSNKFSDQEEVDVGELDGDDEF